MTVVDLATGAPIDEAPADPSLLNALKALIVSIESGELNAETFYLIAECGDRPRSFDNGLTASEAIVLLEREKFHILCALDGLKV